MTLEDRLRSLADLGELLLNEFGDENHEIIDKVYAENQWFTPANSLESIRAVSNQFLNRENLNSWIEKYEIPTNQSIKKVGLILAGNIPIVGFHDVLCTFISGNKSLLKYSSKDRTLLPYILSLLGKIDNRTTELFEEQEQIKGFDAAIATGGEAASSHFRYYLRDIPHIIRKNRTSVAVLTGNESEESLKELGNDIFQYFGLGCRSISKIYIPQDYDLNIVFKAIYPFLDIINHHKYKNNYDYNLAIYSLGQEAFLTNDFIIFKEDQSLFSRIASMHYERYIDLKDIELQLTALETDLQCIATEAPLSGHKTTPLGTCQRPTLSDYADGIDTLDFLIKL